MVVFRRGDWISNPTHKQILNRIIELIHRRYTYTLQYLWHKVYHAVSHMWLFLRVIVELWRDTLYVMCNKFSIFF